MDLKLIQVVKLIRQKGQLKKMITQRHLKTKMSKTIGLTEILFALIICLTVLHALLVICLSLLRKLKCIG